MSSNNNQKKHYLHTNLRNYTTRRKLKNVIIAIFLTLYSSIPLVTLAYIYTNTEPIENVFESSYVACEVIETFNGTKKTDVKIKNTGKVQSYIRAAVIVTWMSEDETKVTALKPVDDTDYVITYANETTAVTNWVKGSDGYWYYKLPVNVEDSTEVLIESCSLKENVTPPVGYYLSVEIVASSIQSTPTNVVTTQWNSGVQKVDGSTLIIK